MQDNTFEIKEITLKDKELFDRYFSANDGINSEYTFTNMFIWRKSYNIRYAIINGMLCVFSQHEGSVETVNYPLGDGDITSTVRMLLSYFEKKRQKPLIRIYSEDELKALETAFPDTFIFTEDRNSFDYVYRVSDLIDLPGSKYHAKRNHINRFLAQYGCQYQKITENHLDACYNMFEHWADNKKDTISNIFEQCEAVKELLKNFDVLKVCGGGIFADGQLAAFSFGEVLNAKKSIAVIHLEHANTDIQGSFPIINQQFLANEWSGLEYVNREEDMGLSGLRRAKKSYHPCFMTKKYIASLK